MHMPDVIGLFSKTTGIGDFYVTYECLTRKYKELREVFFVISKCLLLL